MKGVLLTPSPQFFLSSSCFQRLGQSLRTHPWFFGHMCSSVRYLSSVFSGVYDSPLGPHPCFLGGGGGVAWVSEPCDWLCV